MTIEERAQMLAINYKATDEFGVGYRKGLEDGYIIGANKQKEIDDDHLREVKKMVVDKACDWLFINIGLYVNEQGFVDTYLLDNNFRKAMED